MKKTIKRALITCNIHLTDTDGKSLRVLNLAKLLKLVGFEVTLLVSNCDSYKSKTFSIIKTESRLRNTLKDSFNHKLFFFFRQLVALFSTYLKLLVNGEEYDIIVSTLVGPEIDSLFASILSKLKRIPFIYDYDDPSPEIRRLFYGCGKNDFRFRLSLFTRNMLTKSAQLVITSADSTKSQLLQYSKPSTPVSVLYNLPELTDLVVRENKVDLRKKLGLSTEAFIISYLGNLPNWSIEEVKDKLICCSKSFETELPIIFLIIGGGTWEQYYKKIFDAHGIANCIVITGRQPRNVALEYFVASDVSMLPFELNDVAKNIIPTKLFEAMALGIPIICSKSSNYFKILGADGVYFDGSCNDLQEKIQYLKNNPDKLVTISNNLKTNFLSNYASKKVYSFLIKEFEKLL